MISGTPLCVWCEHWHRRGTYNTCSAFPKGIPAEIFANVIDHRKKHKTQKNNIIYKYTEVMGESKPYLLD